MSKRVKPPELTTPFLPVGHTQWMVGKTCEVYGFAVTPDGTVWISDLLLAHLKQLGWKSAYGTAKGNRIAPPEGVAIRDFLYGLRSIGRLLFWEK